MRSLPTFFQPRQFPCQAWLVILFFITISSQAFGRNVYLNGTDISSARGQLLEGVNIRIDPLGNIFIEAPQYQVNEENTFLPLSSWNTPPVGTPNHRPNGPVPDALGRHRDAKLLPKVEKPITNTPPNSPATDDANAVKAKDTTAKGLPLQEKEGDKIGN